jgi:hypothetical protein
MVIFGNQVTTQILLNGDTDHMTAQFHENLILDGEKMSMAFCPPLPENHPHIIELSYEEAIKEGVDSFVFSTACWRQYIGNWEVQDEKFYLVSLSGKYKMIGSSPIIADWFTGVLRIPKGKLLHYVHMGFGSVYEQEVHSKSKQELLRHPVPQITGTKVSVIGI